MSFSSCLPSDTCDVFSCVSAGFAGDSLELAVETSTDVPLAPVTRAQIDFVAFHSLRSTRTLRPSSSANTMHSAVKQTERTSPIASTVSDKVNALLTANRETHRSICQYSELGTYTSHP